MKTNEYIFLLYASTFIKQRLIINKFTQKTTYDQILPDVITDSLMCCCLVIFRNRSLWSMSVCVCGYSVGTIM